MKNKPRKNSSNEFKKNFLLKILLKKKNGFFLFIAMFKRSRKIIEKKKLELDPDELEPNESSEESEEELDEEEDEDDEEISTHSENGTKKSQNGAAGGKSKKDLLGLLFTLFYFFASFYLIVCTFIA